MPRFKTADYGLKMIPVDFSQQVLPGSFEFALCHRVDREFDLSALRARVANDAGGAPAFSIRRYCSRSCCWATREA